MTLMQQRIVYRTQTYHSLTNGVYQGSILLVKVFSMLMIILLSLKCMSSLKPAHAIDIEVLLDSRFLIYQQLISIL